jgi:uncharacterized protein (DUF1501 family)
LEILVHAFGRSSFLEALASIAAATDRVLVLIQLNGGNDGLNMVIPRDQYSALAAARSNIMIPETKVLSLTDATGLHPSMTGLQALYQEGKLVVCQSVGYPSPNFSHFRATDIWLTGSDSNQILSNGWLGRYLDAEYPGYPTDIRPRHARSAGDSDRLGRVAGAVWSVRVDGIGHHQPQHCVHPSRRNGHAPGHSCGA